MAKQHKGKSAPGQEERSQGEHGGNRGGHRREEAEKPARSSQAEGKDPHRGEREK